MRDQHPDPVYPRMSDGLLGWGDSDVSDYWRSLPDFGITGIASGEPVDLEPSSQLAASEDRCSVWRTGGSGPQALLHHLPQRTTKDSRIDARHAERRIHQHKSGGMGKGRAKASLRCDATRRLAPA